MTQKLKCLDYWVIPVCRNGDLEFFIPGKYLFYAVIMCRPKAAKKFTADFVVKILSFYVY